MIKNRRIRPLFYGPCIKENWRSVLRKTSRYKILWTHQPEINFLFYLADIVSGFIACYASVEIQCMYSDLPLPEV
jgi:hypothetical protein